MVVNHAYIYVWYLTDCFFTCLFNFWLYMCNSLIALFFAMFLRLDSFTFVGKLCTFVIFTFCRFFSVLPPCFDYLCASQICFFFRIELQMVIIWLETIYFVVFLISLPLFLRSFRAPDFSCFSTVLHQFAIACFPFFAMLCLFFYATTR